MKKRLMIVSVPFLLLLAGCRVNVDSPETPTVAASPTGTAVVRLPTGTPSRTPTRTPTATHIPTDTPPPTETITPTRTHTPRPTATDRPTRTPTPTDRPTHTATATQTARPSPTRTDTPTLTKTPTPTETPPIAQIQIPTATRQAAATITPFPSITIPPVTATRPPTLTPGPLSTSSLPSGDGTFYDPGGPPASLTALPVAPAAPTEQAPFAPPGPTLPEQDAIVVSYAGQVVPLLGLMGNEFTGNTPMAQGDIFAVSSSGQVASVGYDQQLYINNARLDTSPSSAFGLPPNLTVGDVVWSPDGSRLAFRVDADNPNEQNAISGGVWIVEPGTRQSWQVFRTGYAGQVAQLEDQRTAQTITWSPNSLALAIGVSTPLGPATVFVPYNQDPNVYVRAVPYADATWTPDSLALIVSGPTWNGGTVVGRLNLDAYWSYTEYLNQATSGMTMRAAIQLDYGAVAFLGSTGDGFALYRVDPLAGAQPVRLSAVIGGQVLRAEWNAARSAVLVTAQTGTGVQLWIIRVDGTSQNTTPPAGAPTTAHWR